MKKIIIILLVISVGLSIFFGIKYTQAKKELDNTDTSALMERITDLTNSNDEKDSLIAELNQHIKGLNNEINEYKKSIRLLNNTIKADEIEIRNLNANLSDLQNEYDKLVAKINELNSVVITFMYKGRIYDVKTIAKGDTVTITNPASSEVSKFLGWSENGTDIIDISNMQFNENKTFIAVLEEFESKYKITSDKYSTYPYADMIQDMIHDPSGSKSMKCNIYVYIDLDTATESGLGIYDRFSDEFNIHLSDVDGNAWKTTPVVYQYYKGTFDGEIKDIELPSRTWQYANNYDLSYYYQFGEYFEMYATLTLNGNTIQTNVSTIKLEEDTVIVIDFTSYGFANMIKSN